MDALLFFKADIRNAFTLAHLPCNCILNRIVMSYAASLSIFLACVTAACPVNAFVSAADMVQRVIGYQ